MDFIMVLCFTLSFAVIVFPLYQWGKLQTKWRLQYLICSHEIPV